MAFCHMKWRTCLHILFKREDEFSRVALEIDIIKYYSKDLVSLLTVLQICKQGEKECCQCRAAVMWWKKPFALGYSFLVLFLAVRMNIPKFFHVYFFLSSKTLNTLCLELLRF